MRSFGVEPEALIGHSIGELVAATLAGVFELPDALRVVAERARLMQSVQAPGGMLAVSAAAQQVEPLLQGLDDVSFAALNAPSQCVISGGSASLAVIAKALAAEGIAAKALVVSHAFHSPLMKEVFPAFAQAFDGIVLHEPRITLVSNVSGAIASADEVREAAYWVRHIGAPVRFAAGMQALAARGRHLFIEVGPAPVLIGLGRASVDAKAHAWAASMHAGDADEGRLLDALAQAYLAGLAVDWAGVQRGRTGARLDLPTHPFDRKRHWLPVAHRHQRPAQASATATHPLLGVRSTDGSSNTGNGGIEFSQRLNAQSPAYLADHVVMGQVIFPAAGYVELLLALQDAVFGETSHEIVDLRIHEALSLRDDRFTVLRTVATPGDDGELEVSVFSRVEGIEGVADRHHVSALLRATPGTSGHDAAQWLASLALRGEADRTQPADALYAAYQAIGLLYGPSFRSVQRVQSWKGELAVGWIDGASAGPELMPPALLDAALQTVAGLLDSDATYLPVCLRSVLLHKKPRGALRSVVRWSEGRPGIDDELTADLLLLEGERAVLSLRGLTLRRAASAAPAPRRLVHDLRWLKRSLVQPVGAASRRVLTMGATLPAELQPSERVACVPADNLESLRDQLTRDPSVADVAWFWPSTPTPHAPQSPQTSPAELDDLRTACEHAYTSLLGLVQLLQRHFFDRKLKLWLVTRGAHADLAASTLWGFGAVLQNESPRWRTTLIDVPATSPAEGWRALIEEWSAGEAGGAENRITWRNGHRHVQRIMPPRVRSDANFRIAIREYGMLSNLMLEPAADAAPGADEIQVEMLTAGINFKDVLNVLGMLRQHALASGQAHVPLPLGFEGAGRVCAAGAQSGFAIGDEVIVNHAGCMQRRITVPALAAVRKPATLDVVQAAGIATAYVTAHYALHALAGMKAGDVVLIHAAAGGVGQAAVQLARRVGAQVLATASPRKWALLRSQGVAHVMNSRTLDFAQEIQRITSGRGVDIVLNSLNKDYIPASLGVLATGGRFVELGKVGVWTPSQMRAERPDVAYHNFDLSEFEPATLLRLNRDILDEVGTQIDAGQLAPIACTEYALDDMEEAFSVLSRGANVGKLVLRLQPDAAIAPPALAIDGESAYLITGGFGALGEHTARSLARGGARHLMLVGRKLPTDDALAALRAGLGNEVMLTAQAADVAQPADVQRLRAALVAGGRPLGGIVHAAGSLADAPIALLDWPAIDAVFKPKVYGGWLLHRMAQSLPGRPFLITYSSVAAVVGSAGQANYAAANAFLDALAGWRAAQGLPSLSIDWGPFADVGMAARLDAAQARSVEERGFRFLKPADGLCTLAELMAAPVSHAAARIVADVDWSRVAHHQSASAPLYALVASAEAAGHAPAGLDIATLMALDRDERARQVNALIRSRIAEMLQFDSADDIAPDTPFVELGLDSLVGLELMNSLEAALGVPLPNSAVFDSPTLPLMTEFILDQLDRQASPRAEEAPLAT